MKKILFSRYELEELFFDEEIDDFMTIARHTVAGEFYYAKEENPRWQPGSMKKRFHGTDNYIIGVGNRPSDLAHHIADHTHRQVISSKQLPCRLIELRPKLVDLILANTRYQIVLRAINAMIAKGEIRYDWGVGIWQISQSNIDGFMDDRVFRKHARRVKHDYRPWHGRPGRDRGTMPEGVSVGLA